MITSPYSFWSNPLHTLSYFNIIIGLGSLLILMNILEYRKWPYTRIYLALLLVGGSFVFLKYSTENETYILPIFISLLGSRQWERGKKIQSSLLLGVATLFHQIHIFWLLGLLFPYAHWKKVKSYFPLFLGLFIPVAVYLGLSLYLKLSLSNVLFHDVKEGLVQIVPDTSNLIFSAINFVRVWFYGSGDMLLFWNLWNPYLSGFALLTIAFALIGLLVFFQQTNWKFNRPNWDKRYVIIAALHIVFAIYSVGNIEFMVMLPFMAILANMKGKWLDNTLMLGMSLLIWNTSQFILPLSKSSPNRLEDKLTLAERLSENRPTTIWTENAPIIENYREFRSIQNRDTFNFNFNELNTDTLPLKIGMIMQSRTGRLTRASMTYNEVIDLQPNRQLIYKDTGIAGTLSIYQ